jgi:hypothetical protein
MRALMPLGVVGLVWLLAAAAIEWLPQTLHYPEISFAASENLVLRFVKYGKPTDTECRQTLAAMRDALARGCPACVREARCTAGLDAEHRMLLSNIPVPMATARIADGVVAYTSSDHAVALSACRQSQQATATLPERHRVKCYEKGQHRK